MAEVFAGGDPCLMHKAGLEVELARLRQLCAAHFDDQLALRYQITETWSSLASAAPRVEARTGPCCSIIGRMRTCRRKHCVV